MSSRPLYISLLLFAIYSLILLTLSFINYSIIKTVLLWIAGLLLFTFVEYLFHRFFFHMEPKGPVKNKVQYAIHGNHHAKPNEATTIMMKPLIAITAIVFTSLYTLQSTLTNHPSPFYGYFGGNIIFITITMIQKTLACHHLYGMSFSKHIAEAKPINKKLKRCYE